MITPEQLAGAGTEHAHQMAFFQWLAMGEHGLPDKEMFFAVPNGGERQRAVAANMKAEGVKSGVPDVCWPVPQGRFTGLWLELKVPGKEGRVLGGRGENQERWHKMLIRRHAAVCTVYGWQAMAVAAMMYWLSPNEFSFHWTQTKMGSDGFRQDTLFVAGNNVDGYKWW